MASKSFEITQQAIIFCMREGYKIYPITEGGSMYVMVEYGSSKKKYHKPFTKQSIHDGVAEIYNIIYEKRGPKKTR